MKPLNRSSVSVAHSDATGMQIPGTTLDSTGRDYWWSRTVVSCCRRQIDDQWNNTVFIHLYRTEVINIHVRILRRLFFLHNAQRLTIRMCVYLSVAAHPPNLEVIRGSKGQSFKRSTCECSAPTLPSSPQEPSSANRVARSDRMFARASSAQKQFRVPTD